MVTVEVEGNGSIWVVWYGTDVGSFFPIVVLLPTQVVEQVHQVGFAVVEEQQHGKNFLVFCEGACSDNMGNKESSVGILSFSDGINLSKFPIVTEVKEIFFYTI